MIFSDSIANLNKEEIGLLYDKWPSIYPLLYHELILSNKKSFEFYNKNMAAFFINLKNSKNNLESVNIFLENIKKIFELNERHKNLFNSKNLYEFLTTFYAWEKINKEKIFNARKIHLENSYKEEAETERIFWRHDGWWNCYYGKLEDKNALNILSKKIKEKSTFLEKIKITLTLAYRLSETNNINKARKIIKNALRFLKLKFFFAHYSEDLEYARIPGNIKNSKINTFLYVFNSYYSDYSRYSLNLRMFLYRTEKSPKKKLHIINKILKENKLSKLFFRDTITKFYSTIFFAVKMYMRPQHILRLIEIRIDKYTLKPNKKLIAEIEYLFKQIFICIANKYYDTEGIIGYFIIIETYLTVYYYLKKIEKIMI